ncbi:unnamed protein product [Didymodactylos carnosus]|uniref:Uncharacterized protein n=1 Tax=Didymodactylos carnosus TaxID=1234261 RepID=A0A8S2F805_9BILA|nr:unnamed protein product [Didymodactylos carnosus]CAF4191556.1 unnamed protein product [Didymodactylos carnosus]
MSLIVHPVDSLYPLVLEQGSGDSLTTAACLQSLSSSEPLTSVTNKKYEQSASINITPVIDGSQKSESKAVDITPPPISNIKKEPYLIPLLANDIIDIFHRVSSKFLAGGSYEPAEDDYNCTILTLHFFVDYIDKDTAFQWLVCPNVPLTVKIRVHNRLYLDEKVELVRVFQKCECHPSFDIKVPFIERIIRDFLTKSGVTMQMLKLCRSINDPKQRAELFLNIIDKNKKKCVKDLIDDSQNDEETLDSLLDCLVEQEILDCGSKKGQLLKYLKKSKERTSAHYELSDQKYLPYLTYGFLVQVS